MSEEIEKNDKRFRMGKETDGAQETFRGSAEVRDPAYLAASVCTAVRFLLRTSQLPTYVGASARAGTLSVGAEAEGWQCKPSEGAGERVVQAAMCSELGRKKRKDLSGAIENGGTRRQKFS